MNIFWQVVDALWIIVVSMVLLLLFLACNSSNIKVRIEIINKRIDMLEVKVDSLEKEIEKCQNEDIFEYSSSV